MTTNEIEELSKQEPHNFDESQETNNEANFLKNLQLKRNIRLQIQPLGYLPFCVVIYEENTHR